MEDKNLVLQAKWDIVKGSCEVKKINHGFCLGFFVFFFSPFSSYLDWLQLQPKRTWLAQIIARDREPPRGARRRSRRRRMTRLTAELAQSLRDSLFLSIS